MPALLIDNNGYIVNANLIYKENLNLIEFQIKIKLVANFFTFDIENILNRLFLGDGSVLLMIIN